jgi:peptidyl-dipeptidase A
MLTTAKHTLALALAAVALSCGPSQKTGPTPPPDPEPTPVADPVPPEAKPTEPPPPTAAEAKQFIDEVDAELRKLWVAQAVADWERSINITDETEATAAKAGAASMAYLGKAIRASRRYDPVLGELDPESARKFKLLRVAGMPAPADAKRGEELARIATEMDSLYGKGKACDDKGENCKPIGEIEDILSSSRDPKALLAAWEGWHAVGKGIRPLYQQFVELANEGAREAGFANVADQWRSRYDMTPAEFEADMDRLWTEVKPLYEQLHCYARRKLSKKYGAAVIPNEGPLPAHMMGNIWAQAWSNVYPLLEPYKGQTSPDVTAPLQKQGYDAVKMVKLAESFFTSIGLDPLPETFWQRSMFTKPADREVVCHASAWDPTFSDDVRIKMCIKVNQEDLITIHHELGHDYYFHYYFKLPILFQDGAHDGFHEAIGDTIALSVTPDYLKKVGLLTKVGKNEKAVINQQMFVALDKIAFLPFGYLMDKWRWDVFSGKVKPDAYNAHWWKLRREIQGIAPASARGEEFFDPGAKYHIPANTPYARYFLSTILQFQFHRALCRASGFKGALHECSIHGSKAAGDKLKAMLAMGSSRPWPEALQAMTGEDKMDATAIIEYFGPLMKWLEKENKGQKCGW